MSIDALRDVVRSGMEVAERRVAASAHNVANVSTEGFTAQEVVATERVGGGVKSAVVQTDAPPSLVREAVTQIAALAAYRANAAALAATDEAAASAVDLFA